MKNSDSPKLLRLSEYLASSSHEIKFVLTDIDDTITSEGKLTAQAYAALWRLNEQGVLIIPVTGRPAGWCELIARLWPVAAVVGENGALAYRYDGGTRKMIRMYAEPPEIAQARQAQLSLIRDQIRRRVPQAEVASDQFCRLFDLAIDFAEDVGPLTSSDVQAIVEEFQRAGATAKVSSIHVNGWFGSHTKLTMTQKLMREEFGVDLDEAEQNKSCCFCGDSPNDEPMFAAFINSFGVANIKRFEATLKHPPRFVAIGEGGDGFEEIANAILDSNRLVKSRLLAR